MKRSEFLSACVAVGTGSLLLPFPAAAREPRGPAARPTAVWPPVDPTDEAFWTFLRGQFPLAGDRAYLNTGGLGASPYAVIDAVKARMDELEHVCETGHTEELWKEVKGAAARLLGCDAGEIAFVRNTTEGINIVANGLPFKSGDEVILTTHEHVGNALTWLALTKQKGIVLKLFEPSTISQAENLDRITNLMSKRTRLISVPHAVTTTGLLLPVKEIAALARAKGIWFLWTGLRPRACCRSACTISGATHMRPAGISGLWVQRKQDCCMCGNRCLTPSLRGLSVRILPVNSMFSRERSRFILPHNGTSTGP
jgi:hypothetical protein